MARPRSYVNLSGELVIEDGRFVVRRHDDIDIVSRSVYILLERRAMNQKLTMDATTVETGCWTSITLTSLSVSDTELNGIGTTSSNAHGIPRKEQALAVCAMSV